MRPSLLALWLISCIGLLQAATLERLSLDELIDQSSAIVRGRVTGSSATFTGSAIYTHYKVQVLQSWKGAAQGTVDVAVPGGTANGLRQTFSGAPQLIAGKEYVLFLWTSKSGLTWITGLSQGLFDLPSNVMAVRAASSEQMLDRATGRPVHEDRLEMQLRDLGAHISANVKRSQTQ